MANSSAPLPPNFFDKKPLVNYAGTLIGVTVTFMTLVWIATLCRLYTRFLIAKAPGWDDLFVVLAAVHVSMGVIATSVATKYGLGQHIYLLTPSEIRSFLICHWLLGESYVASAAFIKLSLLFQYLRIFERGTFIYHFIQILAGVIALWGFSFIFMGWFACFPSPAAFWNGTSKGCYASFDPDTSVAIKTIEGHSGANVGFDFIVLAIAFRLLWEKNGPVNKKGLAALLMMGLIASTFGLWRMIDVIVTEAGSSGFDITWDEPMPQLLTVIEVSMACLCSTTPFFWPIFKEGWSQIFVKFEFSVSTESRWHEDHIELASTNSASGIDSHDRNDSQYKAEYITKGGDPFVEEFRTEASAKSMNPSANGKKGQAVQFATEEV